MALQDTIMREAATSGGFSIRATDGATRWVVGKLVARLVRDGKLHKAKLSHRVVRYYDNARRAQTAVDQAFEVRGVRSPEVKLKQDLPVVVPAGVQVQQIPCGFKPRYEGLVGAVAFGLQRGRVVQ